MYANVYVFTTGTINTGIILRSCTWGKEQLCTIYGSEKLKGRNHLRQLCGNGSTVIPRQSDTPGNPNSFGPKIALSWINSTQRLVALLKTEQPAVTLQQYRPDLVSVVAIFVPFSPPY
jgi:hypothetical protein